MASLSLFDPNNRALAFRRNDPFSLARELFSLQPMPRPAREAVNFVPSFDVKETEEAYLIHGDLPGVNEENLEVTLENNQLSLTGTRASQEEKEGERYHIYERSYGSFTRTFTLPKKADGEGIKAKLTNGVLEVIVPKKAESKARRIPIR